MTPHLVALVCHSLVSGLASRVSSQSCPAFIRSPCSISKGCKGFVWSDQTSSDCHPGTELLQRMATAAEDLLETFSPQNVSNAVMSFAKLDYHPGTLMHTMSRVIPCSLHQFTPQVKSLDHTHWDVQQQGVEWCPGIAVLCNSLETIVGTYAKTELF